MPTITGQQFIDVMNIDITPTEAENLIDVGIDTLNTLGAELSNLSGAAGSKTLTVTSKERGAIMQATRMIYYGFYKGLDQVGVSGLTVTVAEVMANPVLMQMLEKLAKKLQQHAGVPFAVVHDTADIE